MSAPILSTKLYIPPTRSKVVLRPRLIERLNHGLDNGSKLILISAPAGYGKTTLVSEWVTEVTNPVAWLSLDEGDNNLTRFLSCFIAALQSIFKDFGERELSALQSPQLPKIEVILTNLINEISIIHEHFLIILDDYHVIDSNPIDETLTFLLEHQPSHMHICITTREDPNLPLARLRGRGQLTEVRATDLRFTSHEAAEFLGRVMELDLSTEETYALETRTEGWIAGLQLAALSLQGREDIASYIQDFTGSHRFVLDYLAEEVLHRQTEDVLAFLLQTSILDRMCGPLCDAILCTPSGAGQSTLEYLERANLFTVPMDNERTWYRYHHLFANILLQRLEQKSTARAISELHIHASEWHETSNHLFESFQHAIAAKDFGRAARLAESASQGMEAIFQSAAWLEWVKNIPNEITRIRPILSTQMAQAYMDAGKPEESESYLQDAERCLDSGEMVVSDEAQLIPLPGVIAMTRAYNAQVEGDLASTEKFAKLALQLFPEEDLFRRAQASITLEVIHWTLGDLDAARTALSDWMDSARKAGNIPFVVASAFAMADLLIEQGQLREAIRTYKNAIQLASENGREAQQLTAHHHLGLALIFHEMGKDKNVAEQLQKAEKLGEHTTLVDWLYRWHIAQARLLESRGDMESALTQLDEARLVYVKNPIPDVRPIEALKANIYLKQGRMEKVWEWINKRGLSTDDEINYLNEFEHLTLARLIIAEFDCKRDCDVLQTAVSLLERLIKAAEDQRRMGCVIEILLTLARAFLVSGEMDKSIASLEKALSLAEPEGYIRVFVDEGEPIRKLLHELDLRIGNRTSNQEKLLRVYIASVLAAFEIQDEKHTVVKKNTSDLVEPLSEREVEVLRLLRTDLSGPDIANQLVISTNTFHTHTKNIFRKLGVNTRLAAVRRAEELKLF